MVIFQGQYSKEILCIYKKALMKFYFLCLSIALPLVIAIGSAVGYILEMWFAPVLFLVLYSIPYIVVAIYMHIKGIDEAEKNLPSKIVFDFDTETIAVYSKGNLDEYRSIPFEKIKKIESTDTYFKYRLIICQKDHITHEDLKKIQEYFHNVINHKTAYKRSKTKNK